MIRVSSLLLLLWLATVSPLVAQNVPVRTTADPSLTKPVRMTIPAFGVTAEVEVRDLPAETAEAAVHAALNEIYLVEQLSASDGTAEGGIGALNRAAGQDPLAIDPRVGELLVRGLQFCIWSSGAYGPLGGELNELWRGRTEPPLVADLRVAVGSTECSRLLLKSEAVESRSAEVPGKPKKDRKDKKGKKGKDGGVGMIFPEPEVPKEPQITRTVAAVAAGSRVDMRGMTRGFAVDRAVRVLAEHGASNVWVEIGNVWRAMGAGPEGRGWMSVLPSVYGTDEPIDRLWLRDQAVAVFSIGAVRGESLAQAVDQRAGVPPRGVVTVIAVTELAVDAEPLATSLFVLGHREGHMRLGKLSPRPSIYWLLGHGAGAPLESTYRWSELERVWRR